MIRQKRKRTDLHTDYVGGGYSEGDRLRITTGFGIEDIERRSKKKLSCRYGGRERLCGAEGGQGERESEKCNIDGGRLLTLAQNVDASFAKLDDAVYNLHVLILNINSALQHDDISFRKLKRIDILFKKK